ncbi:MAG TPA: hypothetical protein VJ782_06220 [Aeromicrobium sp.]|nr:hypothetical protein [Aeromicrobium sp.]
MMMDSIDTWTRFLGWYTVLNVGMYLITVVMVLTMRDFLVRHSARWFGVTEDVALRTTYQWAGAYKLAIILFGLAPWLALKLMA